MGWFTNTESGVALAVNAIGCARETSGINDSNSSASARTICFFVRLMQNPTCLKLGNRAQCGDVSLFGNLIFNHLPLLKVAQKNTTPPSRGGLCSCFGLKRPPRSRTLCALGPMECGLTNPARAGR